MARSYGTFDNAGTDNSKLFQEPTRRVKSQAKTALTNTAAASTQESLNPSRLQRALHAAGSFFSQRLDGNNSEKAYDYNQYRLLGL